MVDEWKDGAAAEAATESTPSGVATLQRCVSNQCVGEEAARKAQRIAAPRLILSVT